ncbi:hypothetical protein NXS19_001645 [Fusarium pseudograminearum]|uniref:Uncharacterized protein n=1 Tax=Fusarium pseudograminearum (strain CS3096) TaxID=1028729 RepID=K3VMY1_FUSPC|nr:hypothetical protein FPSE_03362 [Fusarium pseudograminearum CS3096]EKJ76452.1 hypothetical protein FPSE_03362 [Fusarium pseudograminearum CS3096]KAF0636408.1 hypothetical protein FPSE5266_03362 [Fusarium pseudograminearum]UZP33829.1 hypothetical protein NXS19_001645 [Fusarium pseudograminearum]
MTTAPSSGSSRPATLSASESTAPAKDLSSSAGEVPIVPTVEIQHLARFEFSDAGTKVLMVEWYPDAVQGPAATADPSTNSSGEHSAPATDQVSAAEPASVSDPGVKIGTTDNTSWQVSWPGKSTNLPAADLETESEARTAPDSSTRQRRRRVFFLLPANATVPSTITITPPGAPSLSLKPLPAIFPPGLAADPGNRGVLHTLWARQRLAAIDREVEDELRSNAEGVGVEMALEERKWILDTFINPPQLPADSLSRPAATRSPTGRLGDKLKGLKLATSPADLTPSTTANTFMSPISQSHPFQPRGRDIAVSSHEAMASSASAGPISLNAALHDDVTTVASAPARPMRRDDDDDLFALPMSPRSPDMKKSPFSAL